MHGRPYFCMRSRSAMRRHVRHRLWPVPPSWTVWNISVQATIALDRQQVKRPSRSHNRLNLLFRNDTTMIQAGGYTQRYRFRPDKRRSCRRLPWVQAWAAVWRLCQKRRRDISQTDTTSVSSCCCKTSLIVFSCIIGICFFSSTWFIMINLPFYLGRNSKLL
jgi:hypothetical protein